MQFFLNRSRLVCVPDDCRNEGGESRNNHRYSDVVQDLATQFIQSYPCQTNGTQETEKSSRKFLEPSEKPKVLYTEDSLEFGKSCEDLSWNQHPIDPRQMSFRKERCAE